MGIGRAFACGVTAMTVARPGRENLCLNERQVASQEAGSHAVA